MGDWLVVWGVFQATWFVFKPVLEELAVGATQDWIKDFFKELIQTAGLRYQDWGRVDLSCFGFVCSNGGISPASVWITHALGLMTSSNDRLIRQSRRLTDIVWVFELLQDEIRHISPRDPPHDRLIGWGKAVSVGARPRLIG